MRLPIKFPSYSIPGFTHEQNAIYARNLWEIEAPNPYARMIRTSTQGVLNNTLTNVVWEQESTVFTRQGLPSFTTGLGYIEIPYDGIWTIGATIRWAGSTLGLRYAGLVKTAGTGSTGYLTRESGSGAIGDVIQDLSASVPLFSGDRVALEIYQNSGGPMQTSTVEALTLMEILGVGVRST